jgi:lysozyme family protein
MTDLNAVTAANAKRWAKAKLTRKAEASRIAGQLMVSQAKQRYQQVEARTSVPWPVIAVIHQRESSQDWTASLAQGDPWNRTSVHVPAGRGPFSSWIEAAVDALVNCPPYLARRKDWSIGGTLAALESYNGLGYASRGLPSPYLWSGTDQYKAGKYVRDGVYDPNTVDRQLGCAALLLAMMPLDPTITFSSTKPGLVISQQMAAKTAPPSITNPSKGSIGAFVVGLVAAIFKRK